MYPKDAGHKVLSIPLLRYTKDDDFDRDVKWIAIKKNITTGELYGISYRPLAPNRQQCNYDSSAAVNTRAPIKNMPLYQLTYKILHIVRCYSPCPVNDSHVGLFSAARRGEQSISASCLFSTSTRSFRRHVATFGQTSKYTTCTDRGREGKENLGVRATKTWPDQIEDKKEPSSRPNHGGVCCRLSSVVGIQFN